jgi:hypothetical protein
MVRRSLVRCPSIRRPRVRSAPPVPPPPLQTRTHCRCWRWRWCWRGCWRCSRICILQPLALLLSAAAPSGVATLHCSAARSPAKDKFAPALALFMMQVGGTTASSPARAWAPACCERLSDWMPQQTRPIAHHHHHHHYHHHQNRPQPQPTCFLAPSTLMAAAGAA